jgi:beta-lactamase regulating signal transducer with metallopeptidase domain/protein involved in polysaccharide export with SLBB domain
MIDSRARESSAAPLPAPAWQLPIDYRLWIVSTYLAGAGTLLAWSLVGFVALRRLVRASQPADAAGRSALQAIAGDASARARLLVSPRAAQPCAFGWIRPTIVLPQALIDSADSTALRFALAHEWSHVSRGDVGVWTIWGFARLLHFQQPLVWLLRQHLRRAQDYLADAAAAGAGTPEDYAEFLTSFSQSFKRPRLAPGLGIVSRRSDLHRRVVMLVEKQGSLERTPPRRWNAAILIAGLLAVAAVASLRAEPQQAAEQQPLSSATPDLEKPTPDDAIPTELRPERIRDTARQRQMIELVVLADPQLQKLRWELEQFVRAKERTPRDRVPNTELYTRILQLEQRVKQREAEVRVAAQKHLVASDNGNEVDLVLSTELAEDPHIQKLTQEKETLEGAMRQSVVNGGTYNSAADNKAAYERVAQLRREIGRVEEQINNRKAKLRDGVTESQPIARPRTTATRSAPFSGTIRPGDILNIEMVGGFPGGGIPPRTVEPDGNIALSPAYGIERIAVGGKSLIEAGTAIATRLKGMLKDPRVLVTYAGHDPDVVAEGEATAESMSTEPIVLEPLDTIDLHLPVKEQTLRVMTDGKVQEIRTNLPLIDDVYVIEPDGNVLLPFGLGRVNVNKLTERVAGSVIHKHLTEQWMPRTALPQISVRKRGHAVFAENKQPPADYRIRPGDSLLIGNGLQGQAFNFEVSADGNLPKVPSMPVHVAGLTLAEAQEAVAKTQPQSTGLTKAYPWFTSTAPLPQKTIPPLVTIGGWYEEADPALIDR